ncbi:Pycsar system effector family protein [Mycobacterium sp. URHB0021]
MANGNGEDTSEDTTSHAWTTLGNVNDWVRHAETKAGYLLAAAGVSGGVLYNLVKSEQHPSGWFSFVSVMCCAGLVIAALSAIWSLIPRLKLRGLEEPTSLLYYSHIVRKFGTDGQAYADSLRTLLSDDIELTSEIAKQTHSIATVARHKYRWASVAAYSLGIGLAFLILLAIQIGSRAL